MPTTTFKADPPLCGSRQANECAPLAVVLDKLAEFPIERCNELVRELVSCRHPQTRCFRDVLLRATVQESVKEIRDRIILSSLE